MNEILLFLLVVAGIFLSACSFALITLGKMIDRYPTGNEELRERSMASPAESTRLAALVMWALFIPGAWLTLQEGRYAMIIGITTMCAIGMFMFTALVFSFAVLSTMKRKRKVPQDTVRSAAPVPSAAPAQPFNRVLGKKPYKPPVSNFLVDALVKKD